MYTRSIMAMVRESLPRTEEKGMRELFLPPYVSYHKLFHDWAKYLILDATVKSPSQGQRG